MADRCACCGREFSASLKRNHIKGYQLCNGCKKMVDVNDIENSIKKVQEEKMRKEKEERERIEQMKLKKEAAEKKRQEILLELSKRKASFLSTSGFNFEGYKIVKYLNVVSGEVVLGTGFFSEMESSVSDFWGTNSDSMSAKLTKAKEMALDTLILHCIERKANAVIGVDLDYMTMKNDMIVACANGTAVVVEKIEDK